MDYNAPEYIFPLSGYLFLKSNLKVPSHGTQHVLDTIHRRLILVTCWVSSPCKLYFLYIKDDNRYVYYLFSWLSVVDSYLGTGVVIVYRLCIPPIMCCRLCIVAAV
jgi:hypothetical protein